MLPKFRPAQLGVDSLARPSIRPVKLSTPPPPPSPPRKPTSGFSRRLGAGPETARVDDDPSTAAGNNNSVANFNGEPSTLNRGPRAVEREIAREQVQASPRNRANAKAVSFEDETQARRVDAGLLETLRRDGLAAPPPTDLGVQYDSLPSLEVRRPYDTYEAEFEEHDPVTQLQGARESARVRRAKEREASYRDEPSYKEPARQEPSYKEPSRQEPSYNRPSRQEPSYKEPARTRQEPSYKEPSRKEPSYRERPHKESSYEDRIYREPEPSYREPAPSYRAPEPAYNAQSEAQNDQEFWGRREESGPRERPSPPPPARSYVAPAPSPSYADVNDSAQWSRDQGAQSPTGWSSMPPRTALGIGPADQAVLDAAIQNPRIPPAPRVPDEMRPAFVVGVQPLRQPTPDAWGTPRAMTPAPNDRNQLPSPMQAIQRSMPYANANAHQAHAHQALPQQAYAPNANPHHGNQQHAPHYAQPGYPDPRNANAQGSGPYAHPHYAQQQQPSGYPGASPRVQGSTPYPGQRMPTPVPMAHPSSSQMQPPYAAHVTGQVPDQHAAAPTPKIGRFAWFVAGAAFGITFAFFATGFFNGGRTTKDEFPAPAPLPTMTAPTTTAPAALAPASLVPVAGGPVAAVAPPVAAVGAVPPVAPVGAVPPVAAVGAVPPVAAVGAVPPVAQIAPPPVAAPVAAAPPPPKAAPVRRSAPRRPVAPSSQAPKNLGGGGAGGDDDKPAPAPSADVTDLLGAGLKP